MNIWKGTLLFSLSLIFHMDMVVAACVGEGGSVALFPNAPQCCDNLKLRPADEAQKGIAGTCISDINCIDEGGVVSDNQHALACCEGLEFQPSPIGLVGRSGTCIKATGGNTSINDSDAETKDTSIKAPDLKGPRTSPY